MQAVRYEARRSLIAGHTDGGLYTINLLLTEKDRRRDPDRKQHVAMSGKTYTMYNRGDVVWLCESAPARGTAAAQWREFLDSVEDGQVFSFDPTYWAGSSPSDMRSVVMTTEGYTETRHAKRATEAETFFKFRFSMREQP